MPTAPETDVAGTQSREIKPLTSLRGVAALAVVLQHFSATAQQHAEGTIPSIAPHGYIAVDFFFDLSGFIMAYTYLRSFERQRMAAYLPFLWKRVARIFPLGIAVTVVILSLGGVASLWGRADLFINRNALEAGLGNAVWVNLLHVQLLFNQSNLNDPAWSISAELIAYLLFPALLAIVFRGPPWGRLAYAGAGAAFLLYVAWQEGGALIYRQSDWWDGIRCQVEFGWGLILYRWYRDRAPICRIGEDRWTWAVCAVCAAAIALRWDPLTTATFPFVVLALALNRGRPARLLASPVPYFLGVISFSIYLVHHLFRAPELALVRALHPAPLPGAAAMLFALAGSLSILPFAALAYYAVERPGRAALNHVARRTAPLLPARAGLR